MSDLKQMEKDVELLVSQVRQLRKTEVDLRRRLSEYEHSATETPGGQFPLAELSRLTDGIVHDLRSGLGIIRNTVGFMKFGSYVEYVFSGDFSDNFSVFLRFGQHNHTEGSLLSAGSLALTVCCGTFGLNSVTLRCISLICPGPSPVRISSIRVFIVTEILITPALIYFSAQFAVKRNEF